MYIPGRSRTGSRPLSTVMSFAAYATREHPFESSVRGRISWLRGPDGRLVGSRLREVGVAARPDGRSVGKPQVRGLLPLREVYQKGGTRTGPTGTEFTRDRGRRERPRPGPRGRSPWAASRRSVRRGRRP